MLGQPAKAQEKIDKKVQVEKAYQPRVKDAYKITQLPEISDTTRINPDFDYYILPRRIEPQVQIDSIPAATE